MNSAVDCLPGVPHVESPLFDRIFDQKAVPPETMRLARDLRRDGFAVFDFPDPDFNRISEKIIKTLDKQFDWKAWHAGTTPNLRVQDAWKSSPEVKQLACNPKVIELLSDLYGRPAFPFQTLNFPVGTQQHFHSDSIHFSSCPERFMAGVWVALEDIDSDNGPLVYYPGSHTLPVFTNEHIGKNPDWGASQPYTQYPAFEKAWEAIVEAMDLKPLHFHAKKGQALIWAANLLHGGSAQKDLKRTRHSQVTHYYFKDCAYYTPLGSVPFLGNIFHRDITDVRTGYLVPNLVNGHAVPKRPIRPIAGAPRVNGESLKAKTAKLPKDFDGEAYLRANPDVRAAKVDPAKHWVEFGQHEKRPLR